MFEAAANGWTDLLRLLLDRCPQVVGRDWRNAKGCTPLWIAAANRQLDCMLALLNARADTSIANDKGSTPLINSCQKNHCAGVGALLAAGAAVARRAGAVNDNSPVRRVRRVRALQRCSAAGCCCCFATASSATAKYEGESVRPSSLLRRHCIGRKV